LALRDDRTCFLQSLPRRFLFHGKEPVVRGHDRVERLPGPSFFQHQPDGLRPTDTLTQEQSQECHSLLVRSHTDQARTFFPPIPTSHQDRPFTSLASSAHANSCSNRTATKSRIRLRPALPRPPLTPRS